jgi:peroxiredoxin
MKLKTNLIAASMLLASLGALYAFTGRWNRAEILEIGAKAPKADVKMPDVSGKDFSLNDLKQKNGLLVIFSCNTCPFVVGNGEKTEGWEGRYPALAEMAAKNGIGFALINPNEAKRNAGDSLEDMKQRYKDKGLKGHYLLDKNHVVADAFGALTTPHVFLFDGDMKLIYKGAIDDSVDSTEKVKEPWLQNAIKAHVSGKKPEPNSTRQMGCSIKRVKV